MVSQWKDHCTNREQCTAKQPSNTCSISCSKPVPTVLSNLFTKILINAHTVSFDFDAHLRYNGKKESYKSSEVFQPVAGDRQESSPAASTVAVLAGGGDSGSEPCLVLAMVCLDLTVGEPSGEPSGELYEYEQPKWVWSGLKILEFRARSTCL